MARFGFGRRRATQNDVNVAVLVEGVVRLVERLMVPLRFTGLAVVDDFERSRLNRASGSTDAQMREHKNPRTDIAAR